MQGRIEVRGGCPRSTKASLFETGRLAWGSRSGYEGDLIGDVLEILNHSFIENQECWNRDACVFVEFFV